MTPCVSDEKLQHVSRRALANASVPTVETDLITAGFVHEVAVTDGELLVAVDMSAHPETPDERVMTAVLEATEHVPGIENTRVERVDSPP